MLLKKARTGFCPDDQPTSSSYLATDFSDCPPPFHYTAKKILIEAVSYDELLSGARGIATCDPIF